MTRPRRYVEGEPRRCPTCGREYPLTEEHWYRYADARYAGGERWSASCRSCEAATRWERERTRLAEDAAFLDRRRAQKRESARRQAARALPGGGPRPPSYATVGRRVGLSRERVRQLVEQGLLVWPPTEQALVALAREVAARGKGE